MKEKQFEVLIVDNDLENLRIFSTLLKNEGYEIRAAKNGKQALTSIEISEPDLVLLDVNMPEMDGYCVCETIRKDSRYENLPIIFLSALGNGFNKVKGYEAGAVDYISKPFEIEEVKKKIYIHLQHKSSLLEINELKAEIKRKDKELEQLKTKLGS